MLPSETKLESDFITWLKKNFGRLFAQAQANSSIGTAYIYGDGQLPAWALLGEYGNGSAQGKGRTEYIWLPTESGQAIPSGLNRPISSTVPRESESCFSQPAGRDRLLVAETVIGCEACWQPTFDDCRLPESCRFQAL